MSYSNISYQLSQTDVNAVKEALTVINQKLPFLITLSKEEKKTLFKLGPKSADFVGDAQEAATNFGQILPPSFDGDEFMNDSTLFRSLSEIKLLLDSLSEKVDDTYTAVGSEALAASLEVYAYVQTAKDRTPGLKSLADKLKERFRAQGARKKKQKGQDGEK